MALIQKRFSIFEIMENGNIELFFNDTYISEFEALQHLNTCNLKTDFKFIILATYKVLDCNIEELNFTID